jgi:hypothetical protein
MPKKSENLKKEYSDVLIIGEKPVLVNVSVKSGLEGLPDYIPFFVTSRCEGRYDGEVKIELRPPTINEPGKVFINGELNSYFGKKLKNIDNLGIIFNKSQNFDREKIKELKKKILG